MYHLSNYPTELVYIVAIEFEHKFVCIFVLHTKGTRVGIDGSIASAKITISACNYTETCLYLNHKILYDSLDSAVISLQSDRGSQYEIICMRCVLHKLTLKCRQKKIGIELLTLQIVGNPMILLSRRHMHKRQSLALPKPCSSPEGPTSHCPVWPFLFMKTTQPLPWAD